MSEKKKVSAEVTNVELVKLLNSVGQDRVLWVYRKFIEDRQKRYAYNKRRNAEMKSAVAFAKAHPDYKG